MVASPENRRFPAPVHDHRAFREQPQRQGVLPHIVPVGEEGAGFFGVEVDCFFLNLLFCLVVEEFPELEEVFDLRDELARFDRA